MKSINNILFFDVEAVPTKDEVAMAVVFPMPSMPTPDDAPINYGEEARLKWVTKEYDKRLEKRERSLRSAALDIDSAVVRSIAFAVGDGEIEFLIGDEGEILEQFSQHWNQVRKDGGVSCGFNSINYDWSLILRRFVANGIDPLYPPNMNRYSGEIDLFNIASNFGYAAGRNKGLKDLAKLFGIEPLVEGMDGSMVDGMSVEDLELYNKSDVHLTREVFKKMNGVYF